jgi:diguanylate cyclase
MQIIKEKRTLRLVKPLAAVKKEAVAVIHRRPAAGVSDYYKRIERYAQQIRQTTGINEIIDILDVALFETRALNSSAEVRAAQEHVQRAERKIELLKNELEHLRELALADPLTGAVNRGGLDEAFSREAARADRRSSPFCVALLDLDDFKQLNDTRGHQAGDNALQHLVKIARQTLRPNDIIARFGGEEFVILLPDTGIEAAVSAIYRLQHNLATRCFLHASRPLPITFSAGVTSRAAYEHQSRVIGRADDALYEAKHAGKNRVVAAPW